MNMPATAARLTTGALLKMGIEDVMDGGMENSPFAYREACLVPVAVEGGTYDDSLEVSESDRTRTVC